MATQESALHQIEHVDRATSVRIVRLSVITSAITESRQVIVHSKIARLRDFVFIALLCCISRLRHEAR